MTNDVQISEREREILSLVATGATNQQIAFQLNISVNTVKVHLRNIFVKIGVVSRTEATIYAIRNGLVPTGQIKDGAVVAVLPEALVAEDAQSLLSATSQPIMSSETDDPVPSVAISSSLLDVPEPSLINPTPTLPAAKVSGLRMWLPFIIIFTLVAIVLVVLPRIQSGVRAPAFSNGAGNVITSTVSLQWKTRATLSQPRDNFAAVAFDLQHEIYVFGGADDKGVRASIDRYDPVSNLWVSLGEKPTPVQHVGAVTLRGKIYLPGGEDSNGRVRDILEIYDPRERRWSDGPPLPAPRSRYTLVSWEGQIYLIGGWDGQKVREEVFIFDPNVNNWSKGPALPLPRQQAGAVVLGGRLYLIGGEGAEGPLRDSARLDPSGENGPSWRSIAPLPQPIAAPAVAAPLGKLLALDAALREGVQYNEASDVWQPFAVPEDAQIARLVVELDNSVYFIAGATAPNPGTVGQYQPVYTVFLP